MDLVELAGGPPARVIATDPVIALAPRRFELTIEGEPVAKARPKLGIVAGHAHAFTPKRTRQYDDIVRNIAAREWGSERGILQNVAITMRITVHRGIPASWPKKKQEAARRGELRPMGKPDWDNFGKAVSDGLNGIVYLDDALVVDASVAKWYSERPRVEVVLEW